MAIADDWKKMPLKVRVAIVAGLYALIVVGLLSLLALSSSGHAYQANGADKRAERKDCRPGKSGEGEG